MKIYYKFVLWFMNSYLHCTLNRWSCCSLMKIWGIFGKFSHKNCFFPASDKIHWKLSSFFSTNDEQNKMTLMHIEWLVKINCAKLGGCLLFIFVVNFFNAFAFAVVTIVLVIIFVVRHFRLLFWRRAVLFRSRIGAFSSFGRNTLKQKMILKFKNK